jgi:hypothetical protein
VKVSAGKQCSTVKFVFDVINDTYKKQKVSLLLLSPLPLLLFTVPSPLSVFDTMTFSSFPFPSFLVLYSFSLSLSKNERTSAGKQYSAIRFRHDKCHVRKAKVSPSSLLLLSILAIYSIPYLPSIPSLYLFQK